MATGRFSSADETMEQPQETSNDAPKQKYKSFK